MQNKTKRALRKRKRKRHELTRFKRYVSLDVDALEIAKGFDGLLRGAPEPVLVCGMFALSDENALLIGRGVGRFTQPRRYPTTVSVADATLVRGHLADSEAPAIAVVVLALEEDGGGDIQRAYAMLQAHDELHLLETCDSPAATDLGELLRHPADWQRPKKVALLVDGKHFDADCRSDKWVAAAAFTTPSRATHRVHLLSPDQKNDWTAVLRLRRS